MGQPKPFAVMLRKAMRRQQMSARRLGKLIRPEDPELGRRTVFRHLAGTEPTDASRAAYAVVLKAPELVATEDGDAGDVAALRRAARILARRVSS